MREFQGAFLLLAGLLVALVAFCAGSRRSDSVGPINFEASEGYAPGSINGQQGWQKSGIYDVNVKLVGDRFGFGPQALQLSDAFTSGSFGDQTFSPGL